MSWRQVKAVSSAIHSTPVETSSPEGAPPTCAAVLTCTLVGLNFTVQVNKLRGTLGSVTSSGCASLFGCRRSAGEEKVPSAASRET